MISKEGDVVWQHSATVILFGVATKWWLLQFFGITLMTLGDAIYVREFTLQVQMKLHVIYLTRVWFLEMFYSLSAFCDFHLGSLTPFFVIMLRGQHTCKILFVSPLFLLELEKQQELSKGG